MGRLTCHLDTDSYDVCSLRSTSVRSPDPRVRGRSPPELVAEHAHLVPGQVDGQDRDVAAFEGARDRRHGFERVVVVVIVVVVLRRQLAFRIRRRGLRRRRPGDLHRLRGQDVVLMQHDRARGELALGDLDDADQFAGGAGPGGQAEQHGVGAGGGRDAEAGDEGGGAGLDLGGGEDGERDELEAAGQRGFVEGHGGGGRAMGILRCRKVSPVLHQPGRRLVGSDLHVKGCGRLALLRPAISAAGAAAGRARDVSPAGVSGMRGGFHHEPRHFWWSQHVSSTGMS
nr:hypothetical protein CFP56_52438 [Quercus suber]